MVDQAPDHERHLTRAESLARGGWGHVGPNPMVGCVIVRNDTIVGEGCHEHYGGAHAEVNALARAGEAARGATAYVTLEPCCHEGKTPPCTGALLDSGVTRVVFGTEDPGRDARGGASALREAGVEVVGPVFSPARSRALNAPFLFAQIHNRPFVAIKLAISMDGRISARPGERTPLTGEQAADEVHRLRAGFGAVMVGANTARVDDPHLTVRRGVSVRRQPHRIVVDSRASLSPVARLFEDVERAPILIFVTKAADKDACQALELAGATVVRAGSGKKGVDLARALAKAWDIGIRSVLCEGGGELAGALLNAGLVERLNLFIVPTLLGQAGVPAFGDAWELNTLAVKTLEGWTPGAQPATFGVDTLITLDRNW